MQEPLVTISLKEYDFLKKELVGHVLDSLCVEGLNFDKPQDNPIRRAFEECQLRSLSPSMVRPTDFNLSEKIDRHVKSELKKFYENSK